MCLKILLLANKDEEKKILFEMEAVSRQSPAPRNWTSNDYAALAIVLVPEFPINILESVLFEGFP